MAKDFNNQIVGICRFSYLGDGGFEVSKKKTEEKLAEVLYDQQRMNRRFAFFEHLCLPSLAAQTDQDFRLVVLIGTSMPIRFRRRLKDLADVYKFMQVVALEPMGPLNVTKRAFRRGTPEDATHLTGFRIDDDDAVATDYIAKTREISDQLLHMGWADDDHPAVIAFHRGIYWDMNDQDDPFYKVREIGPLGLASAMVTKVDDHSNMFRWNHRRVAAYARCWSDPTDLMFVRTLHGHNDSDRSIPPGAEPIKKWDGKDILRGRFGLDPDQVVPLMWRKFKDEKDEGEG